jgi:hypothetical protein
MHKGNPNVTSTNHSAIMNESVSFTITLIIISISRSSKRSMIWLTKQDNFL